MHDIGHVDVDAFCVQIGLVEKEWLDTLATINPGEVTFTDYVSAGAMLAKELKEEKGCELVIALTHMRTPNDIRLAESVDAIDIILGGHDHVYEKKLVSETHFKQDLITQIIICLIARY